jgi:hypothetical protein
MKFYIFFSAIMSVVSPFITLSRGVNYTTNISYENNYMTFCAGIGVMIMTVFFYFAINSMSLTFRLTTRAGISKELREEYANGRILYLIIYMLCWIGYFALNYYVLFLNVIIYSSFSLES